MKALFISDELIIRQMSMLDISPVCRAYGDESGETAEYLRQQLENQQMGKCIALLAVYHQAIAGYVFLYYACPWGGMGGTGMPGIIDLIVFEAYRNQGVAGKLLDIAENIASQYSDSVYLDVRMTSVYGMALKLYIRRGYVPDGKGIYYQEQLCPQNAAIENAEELSLCLIKKLVPPKEVSQ